jgi:F-type H+-transporting ATPase subunit a
MTRIPKLAIAPFFLVAAHSVRAAESQGIAPSAETVFNVGPIPITNSMLMTWLVGIGLVVLIRLSVGKAGLVPTRSQAIVENLVEGVRDIVSPIVGNKAIKATLPLLLALFTYILIQNWSGLIPGVGNLLVRKDGEWVELVRPAHADMNGTVALSLISFAAWLLIVWRFAGPRFILKDLFGNKADKRDVPGVIYYLLFPIFFAVGCLEVVSILFRPVSLSFRLYGNIFGGENLLHSMSNIFRWGLPVPFYFMELLVGLVQAFVFTLLVSVYVGLLCNHGDDHGEGGHEEHKESH